MLNKKKFKPGNARFYIGSVFVNLKLIKIKMLFQIYKKLYN